MTDGFPLLPSGDEQRYTHGFLHLTSQGLLARLAVGEIMDFAKV